MAVCNGMVKSLASYVARAIPSDPFSAYCLNHGCVQLRLGATLMDGSPVASLSAIASCVSESTGMKGVSNVIVHRGPQLLGHID